MNNSLFIITKNDDFDDFTQTFNYEIERLFNKRIIFTNKINYLIKWKNYDFEHNVWYFFHVFNSLKNFVDDYDRQHFRSIVNIIVIHFIIVDFVRQQLLLKILLNTKFVKQSTTLIITSLIFVKKERDKRDKNRFRNKFQNNEIEDKVN